MDPRLLNAISNRKIQSQAGELVQLALRALDDLKQLDEGLYERFVASRIAPNDRATSEASLRKLWDLTFGGMTKLLVYCKALTGERKRAPSNHDDAAADDSDWADLEDTVPVHDLALGSSDIGDLLDGIDEHVEEGDGERWAKVVETLGSIDYGLRSQLADARARVEVALGAGETNQVLALLDDTQSAAAEGVHALVSAVYQAFVPGLSPASVVPGYLTSLSRALLVRHGLAELAATLTPRNAILQADDAGAYAAALDAIRTKLHEFVSSVVWRAMRPADRWQMFELERALATQPIGAARQTSEGLVKYLDSLGSINQREVLVLHDRRAIDEMRESLANARELVEISPRTAIKMAERAYEAAQRLTGRGPAVDELIGVLEWYVPATGTAAEIRAFLERLETVLAATGG